MDSITRNHTMKVLVLAPAMTVIAASGFSPAHGQCETWQPLSNGANTGVFALAPFENGVLAGGIFSLVGQGVQVNRIARWDGSSWHAMHTGVNGRVSAITVQNGQPFIGGEFTTASFQTANRIARWNGIFWQPLASGTNGPVHALTTYNNQVIAGGLFTEAGGLTSLFIARWTGAIWQPLGQGTTGPVSAMTVFNGELIAGGDFVGAGDIQVHNIARWNGSQWQALGGGTNGEVLALTEYNGDLIAGGSFTMAGGVPADRIARWDGSAWHPLGSGIFGEVYDLAVYNGELIASGFFSAAGGTQALNIARWDGSSWRSMDNFSPSGTVEALTVTNGSLYAGGFFSMLGTTAASRVAQWRAGASISPHPQGGLIDAGDTIALAVNVSNPQSGPYTYRWRKNGTPLSNGGNISGATSPTLTISAATTADFGAYDVVVSNACGSVVSNPAALAVLDGVAEPNCTGDLDLNGVVDVTDLFLLLGNWGECP